MKELTERKVFCAEVDRINKSDWHALIQQFDDANLYQTWSHGAFKWGEDHLSHLVLRRNGVVVAAVQMTVLRFPVLRAGAAHTRFGPMWLTRGRVPDPEVYREVLRAMREEYVERRGLLLRLKPWEDENDASAWLPVKKAQGFRCQRRIAPYDTFVLDLSFSRDEIYQGLARKWRNDLNKARERGMQVAVFQSGDALKIFNDLYREMYQRKGFSDSTDIDLLAGVCRDLPAALKPWIMVCTYEEEPVAAIVFSLIGNRALALFGASSPKGLRLGASYLVNWAVVSWLKEDGRCRWYDLVGGLSTPGIHHFKAGLAKGCGKKLRMYDFDASRGVMSRFVVSSASALRPLFTWVRTRLRWLHRRPE